MNNFIINLNLKKKNKKVSFNEIFQEFRYYSDEKYNYHIIKYKKNNKIINDIKINNKSYNNILKIFF